MAVHLLDVTLRLLVERDVDPESLPGDFYARIEEHLIEGETIIDGEITEFTLPVGSHGSRDSGNSACPQENK